MRTLTVLLALAVVLPAAAVVPVTDLYDAAVPVPDQSPRSREPALQQALEAVLVRITGTRQLPAARITPLLAGAQTLLQSYAYETPAGDGRELQLKVRFDARAVDAALRRQGLPVWGLNRPSHLVWIALRDDGQPGAVLDADAATARAGALLATAEARGLPMVFPKRDADPRSLPFTTLWAGDFMALDAASRPYRVDAVLVGRVGREGERWLGRWTLLAGPGPGEEWITAYDTLDQTLSEGLHELADRQARRFAVLPGVAQDIRLQVSGITSLRDYSRALHYLSALNPVRDTQVETVAGPTVTFRLKIESDPGTLERLIAAGNVLRRPDDPAPDAKDYVLVR
ncbi:MAG: DUF2066 domain-containing protein [Nevskiales bacterium]|nr:DUF2066 domain-containing protein [Nevskiales bacterium]